MNAACLYAVRIGIAVTLSLALTACASPPLGALPSPSATISATVTPGVPTTTSTVEAPATASQAAATAGPPTVETHISFGELLFHLPPEVASEAHSRETDFSEILGEQYPPHLESGWLRTLSDPSKQRTRFIANNIEKEISDMKTRPGKNIVMFGSPGLAKSMMRANLIDEYWLFVNPVIRGEGNALFQAGLPKIDLKLNHSELFPSGVNLLQYTRQ